MTRSSSRTNRTRRHRTRTGVGRARRASRASRKSFARTPRRTRAGVTAYGRDLRVDLNAARREAAVRRVAERRARLEARASSMTSSSVRTTTTTTMPPGSPRAKEVAELFAPLSLPSSPVRAIARGDDDDDDPSPAKRSNRPSPRRRPKGGGKSPGVLNMIARLERTLVDGLLRRAARGETDATSTRLRAAPRRRRRRRGG